MALETIYLAGAMCAFVAFAIAVFYVDGQTRHL